MNVILILC